MIRYAVVGADGYSGRHVDNIERHGRELGCKLTGVAIRPQDRRPGQVEGFAARGVEVFADAAEMFQALAGSVEGVFIPTGIHTHCELTCAALAAGHNVYLEKPPAATIQEVDRMLSAISGSGRICALGFQAIFSESVNLIKERVVSGALGGVRRLRCWALWPRADQYYKRNEWAGRLKVGDAWVLDGPSNNALSHEIANMLYWASARPRQFATPQAVRAELYHARDIDSEDTSAIEIVTDWGATALFVVSHCTAGRQVGPWIEAECEEGRVWWQFDGRTEITYADGRRETHARDAVPPPLAALANFTEAVRAGDAGLLKCDLTMGRNFTLALNGAFESAGGTRGIPARYLRRSEERPGPRTVIEGVNEAIVRCAKEDKLFSEIGCPWAVKTEPFDLTGYDRFPQRFRS